MNTYTNDKMINSNTDIDGEPEFIMTDDRYVIARNRRRAMRIRKQQKRACFTAGLMTFISFFVIYMGCLMIVVKIHPETVYGFLIAAMIIGFVLLCIGATVYGYLHESIHKNWKLH